MSRSWRWNGRLLVISGLLGMSLTTAAAAGTTGEKALLNQAGPRVLVDRKAGAHAVDGAHALLSHAGAGEPSLGLTSGIEGRAPETALSIDGPRALLGFGRVAFHSVPSGR